MDVLEVLKALLYGLVEGISEWLPISSTGHMLLLERICPLNVSEAFWNMFLVVIQLGAILAVCVLYFRSLNPFDGTKSAEEKKNTWILWAKIVLACLPAALVGIPLDDWMEEHLSSPYIIAAALIFYGVLFIVIERRPQKSRPSHAKGEESKSESALDISWAEALGMGVFQILALVPGTSRSGSTIIGGLLLGCSRPVAAEFTFFLAIPVMFGASLLRMLKFFLGGATLAVSEAIILLVGCMSAFVVSLAAIRFLVGFVRKHSFEPFGWYRIVLGIVVLISLAIGFI